LKTFTAVTLLVVTAVCAWAEDDPPAGIVLYLKSGADVYLLLSDHAGGEGRRHSVAAEALVHGD
jgi:hypothetical protein